jgi:hypothetical protein
MTGAIAAIGRLGEFVAGATPPAGARRRAAGAFLDTVGVTLAGAVEPASRIVESRRADGGDRHHS